MRLSAQMKEKLQKAVLESFGNVPVYLFGSRVDDQKKDGDIDLAVDVDLTLADFRQCKVRFKTILISMGFDQIAVDVVPYHSKDKLLFREICRTAVRLF